MRKTAITFTILLGLVSLWIAKSFLVPILFGATIAALLSGPHSRLKTKLSSRWAAFLLTLGSTFLIILPVSLLIIAGVRSAAHKVRVFRENLEAAGAAAGQNVLDTLLQVPVVDRYLHRIADVFGMETQDVIQSAEQAARKAGLLIADVVGGVAQRLPQFSVEIFLVLLAIYFTLVDGYRVGRLFRENSPFPKRETDEILSSFQGLCRSVLLASVASGFAQATTYLIGLVIAGSPAIPIVTLLVFLTSFIPLFGSSPVTLGYALYILLTVGTGKGIILFIAALVTGIVDNFVKPAVLKGSANIHPLLALVALFGGLEVFGFTGLFLGPIAVGLFLVTLDCLLRTRSPENRP